MTTTNAIGEYRPTVWGIGLPFDHPIWESINNPNPHDTYTTNTSLHSQWPATKRVERIFYTWAEAVHAAKDAPALDRPRVYRVGNQWCLTYTIDNRMVLR